MTAVRSAKCAVRRTTLIAIAAAALACVQKSATTDSSARAAATVADSANWKDLNGLTAWRGYRMDSMPSGWSVVDGALGKSEPVEDIVTRDQYGDFELELEWKIGKGGNAGLFYRGTEEFEKIYFTAPEYQLLDDDNHGDGRSRMTAAGSVHSMYPAPSGHLKPVGEWNSTRVVARGPHVEHWLNGAKLLAYELWTPDWEARYKASKFAEWAPKYGRSRSGFISIQGDHTGVLALRNIRIRELR
jgi:hypothetical protein